MKKQMNALLCASLVLGMTGCGQSASETTPGDTTTNTTAPIEVKSFESFYSDYYDDHNVSVATEAAKRFNQFAVDLLKKSYTENQNEIISPLSLYYALGILANGASGQTRAEIETVMGMNIDDANRYLYDRSQGVKFSRSYSNYSALWFNNDLDLTLKPEYVSTVQQYYGDCIFEKSFKDPSAIANEANLCADQNTNGAINQILNELDITEDMPFLILNALATGDTWVFPFDATLNKNLDFANRDGTSTNTKMMFQEYEGYWSGENCEGFVAPLDNFIEVAFILPNEGIDIYDYIASMDGNTIMNFVDSEMYWEDLPDKPGYANRHFSNVTLPKFTYDKDYDIGNALKAMGLSNLFDVKTADFSNMADGDATDKIYVKDVKQKDKIYVDEKRVEAAAVTVIVSGLGSDGDEPLINEDIYHDITFDRPFLFALLTENCPLFIGVVTNMASVEVPADPPVLRLKENVNVRSRPSTDAEKYETAKAGTEFEYTDTIYDGQYTWYQINYGYWTAYVADKNGEWIELLN